MYAIVFDLDNDALMSTYVNPSTGQHAPQSHTNAWTQIRTELEGLKFDWIQRSVYFGRSDVTAVDCVLAVQHLTRKFSWFAGCVQDIRMLRIEEKNDLQPAIAFQVSLMRPDPAAPAPATAATVSV